MKYKQMTAILAAAALLLCGCQRSVRTVMPSAPIDAAQTNETAESPAEEPLTAVVKAERLSDLPEGFGGYSTITQTQDGFAAVKDRTTLWKFTPDFSAYTELQLPALAPYDGFYEREALLCAGRDAYYRLVMMENHGGIDPDAIADDDYEAWENYDTQEVQFAEYLCTYTADGTLSGKVKLEGYDAYRTAQRLVYSLYCDGENRFMLLSDGTILRIRDDGSLEMTKEPDADAGYILPQILTDRDGVPVYYDFHEETAPDGACMETTVLCEFDVRTGKPGKELFRASLPNCGRTLMVQPGGCGEFRLFAYTEAGVAGIRDDGTTELVIDWNASDLDSLNVLPLADGTFLGCGISYDGSGNVCFRLTRQTASAAQRDERLTLAVIGRGSDVLREFVQSYNRSHDVRIDTVSYADNENQTAIDQLKQNIATGDAPDLVVMYDDHDQFLKLGSKAVFTDLNPYLDADPEVRRDRMVPNVLAAMQHPDGSLYALASGFVVDTIAVKSKFGVPESWTADDMIALYDGADDIVYYWSTKQDALALFMAGADFTDELAGTCRFDSPEFVKILEFCNRYPAESTCPQKGDDEQTNQDWYTSFFHACRDDEDYLFPLEISAPGGGFAASNWSYAKTQIGDSFTYAGYPSDNGQGGKIKQCSRRYTQLGEIGIVSTCPDKDAAWDVVREFTIDSMEYNECPAFSVFEDTFEEQLDGMMYIWEDGKPSDLASVEDDGTVYPMTQEERDDLERYIRSCTTYMTLDDTVESIVYEEAGQYFAGDQSAEDAAKSIQNRAELYLSEQG